MERTRLKFNNRSEWLDARRQGIGASEVSAIVGLNPWLTPYQLWRNKMGLDAPKIENFAMKAGHYLESAVSNFFADESGVEIIQASVEDFMFVNPQKPYLRVSPDRTYWLPDLPHNDDNKGILECKTTQRNIDPEDLPKHWFCQVQMNLGVAGYEHGALAWLTAGREFGWRYIDYAPDFFGWLSEEVDRFWVDNVLGEKEPEAISVNDVVLKYSRHVDGNVLEVGDDVFAAYKDLKDLKKQIAALEEHKETLEERLKLAFKDAEAITYGGETIATWKAPKPSKKFNAKLFCESNPTLAAEFTEEVQGARRFVLK